MDVIFDFVFLIFATEMGGHVARMGEMGGAYRILVGRHQGR
jgi:hypothetical protein